MNLNNSSFKSISPHSTYYSAKTKSKTNTIYKSLTNSRRSSLSSLCKTDESKIIPKSLMTPENFRRLKELARRHNVKMTDEKGHGLSYSQYCLLIKDREFYKPQCCPDGKDTCIRRDRRMCCQATLEDNTRCKYPAQFVYDLMDIGNKEYRRPWISRIPASIKPYLSTKQKNYYEQILANYPCCFYCQYHIGAYLAEGASYLTNISYYAKHPEEILSVFYNDVQVQKSYGFPIKVALGELKPREDISIGLTKLLGGMSGALSGFGMFVRVFFFIYDRYLSDLLSGRYLAPLLDLLNAYMVRQVPL